MQPFRDLRNRAQHFTGDAFSVVAGVTRDAAGKICVGEQAADGLVIYGPYQRLAPGRYRVGHFLEVSKVRSHKASIEIDIVVGGVRRIAIKHHPISRHGGS